MTRRGCCAELRAWQCASANGWGLSTPVSPPPPPDGALTASVRRVETVQSGAVVIVGRRVAICRCGRLQTYPGDTATAAWLTDNPARIWAIWDEIARRDGDKSSPVLSRSWHFGRPFHKRFRPASRLAEGALAGDPAAAEAMRGELCPGEGEHSARG